MIFNQREIVLVPFPYSDLSAFKNRPVLIISNNKYNNSNSDILVVAITSKEYLDDYSIILDNSDLEYGLFPESSIIKVGKLFSISKSKIIKKFSIIKVEKYEEIIVKLKQLIDNKQ
ncbi:MAG TPA: type II toxin-antitoxin system PemK/MazF family toxin [Candidatus Kapabacteria bacterium]|nr:type II toxin-antitoxin system PemK/MazF family toxin [Candidatus Kapabacteria bacterium]